VIATVLQNKKNLLVLDVTSNKIMAKGCIDICKAIQHHTTLREILMSNNFIGPDGARQLAHKVLADTKYITEVHLANNGIFPDGAKEIGIALANKKYLEVLNLRRNDIGKEGISELEKCLLASRIKELDLSGNKIGDEGCRIVVKSLIDKPKLMITSLNLSDNAITSEGCKLICSLVDKARMLDNLQL
jgi:Ran GTPase-activating protein (RanGAP) involved in mRNA processing and transport